jgi:hypothetical protein
VTDRPPVTSASRRTALSVRSAPSLRRKAQLLRAPGRPHHAVAWRHSSERPVSPIVSPSRTTPGGAGRPHHAVVRRRSTKRSAGSLVPASHTSPICSPGASSTRDSAYARLSLGLQAPAGGESPPEKRTGLLPFDQTAWASDTPPAAGCGLRYRAIFFFPKSCSASNALWARHYAEHRIMPPWVQWPRTSAGEGLPDAA